VSNLAITALQALNVKVRFQTRVTSTSSPLNDDIDKLGLPVTLTLSDNTTIHTDMYIPSFGLIPNSGYVPAPYLNPDGYVRIDEFMNVKAEGEAAIPNVWALGDVADLEYAQFVSCDKQSVHLAKNMLRTLKDVGGGKKVELVPYKATTKRRCYLSISSHHHSFSLQANNSLSRSLILDCH
jgi:thioredoxin reductase